MSRLTSLIPLLLVAAMNPPTERSKPAYDNESTADMLKRNQERADAARLRQERKAANRARQVALAKAGKP